MAEGEVPPRVAPLEALLPGLPDDVALHVVARVPRGELPLTRHVSRAWRASVRSVRLYAVRRELGLAEPWLYALTEEPRGAPFHVYDPQRDTWHAGPPMGGEGAGEGFACAAANGKLFVLGGTWNGEITADVRFFDPITNKWGLAAPMTSARAFFGCSVIADRVYVTGGRDDTTILKSAEVYVAEEDRWEPIASMEMARAGHSSVVMDGKLWALGGGYGHMDLPTQSTVRSTERFCPKLGTWCLVEDTGLGNNKVVCAVVNEKLYSVDGYGFVRTYNPRTNQLTPFGSSTLLYGKFDYGWVPIGDRIYFFGGEKIIQKNANPRASFAAVEEPRLNGLYAFHVTVAESVEHGADGGWRIRGLENIAWNTLASMGANRGRVLGHAVLSL